MLARSATAIWAVLLCMPAPLVAVAPWDGSADSSALASDEDSLLSDPATFSGNSLSLFANAAAPAQQQQQQQPQQSSPAAPPSSVDKPWAQLKLADGTPTDGSSGSLSAAVDSDGSVVLLPGAQATGSGKLAAWGTFTDSLDQIGWSGLSMHTSDSADVEDKVKMYAAGVVEGYLTAQRIKEFHHNSRVLVEMTPENHDRLPNLKDALGQTAAGLLAQGSQDGSDAFATQSQLAFLQTWGVRDGYSLASSKVPSLEGSAALSMVDMFILNSDGVIDELLAKYGGDSSDAALLQRRVAHRKTLRGTAVAKASSNLTRRTRPRVSAGHCTGLARLTDDKSELYFGHTTWEAYSEMTRLWKVYDFPLKGTSARKISFSSYPACVSSTDDYYIMDSGLAITETTLNIPNKERFPAGGTVPDFIRIMAANRLSSTGKDWVQSMSDSATGTYSSQWMVLDYKKFTPGSDLPEGTFYVLEQAPGVSHYEDMSSRLQKKGYWASYDRAFFDDTRDVTGDSEKEAQALRQDGPKGAEAELYSKANTPRAQIARKTASSVNSLASMRDEMTRNMGTQEPVDNSQLQVPRYAISARNDLKDSEHINPDGSPDGGVDAKITSSCLFKDLAAEAISGPAHNGLPAFRWTKDGGGEAWPGYPHEGLPDEANFAWSRTDPSQDEVVSSLSGDGACQ